MERIMMENFDRFPPATLAPTSQHPLHLRDATASITHGMGDILELHGMQDTYRCLYLEDKEQGLRAMIDCDGLSILEIKRLAAGEELCTPCGQIEVAGRLRMMRGLEYGTFTHVTLEFLPDQPVAEGMSFRAWFQLRFPGDAKNLSEMSHEPWWIYYYHLWATETCPASTIAPDHAMLCQAALNNHERLLDAILAVHPRIEVKPGMEKSIIETALGIAMENTGMFGMGAGLMTGCHRNYREDDFSMAEDSDTWVARAECTADRLMASGAIDYSPMFAACRAGRTEEVEAMLKAGFPPNFSIYGHTTALSEAVHAGHEDICDLLLCHGADPNLSRPFESSMVWGGEIYPLSIAMDHPGIFKRLLQAGANPSQACDDSDETPVVFAMKLQDPDHAEEIFGLVDFRSIRGKHGRSGVFYMGVDQLEKCRNLIPEDLFNERDQHGMTPLLHAISFDYAAKARLLIELGADPGQPGILWASEANCVWRDCDTGPIPNQCITPIQAALEIGDLQLVEHLFDRGVPAPRHSWELKLPESLSKEDAAVLFETLRTDLECHEGVIPLESPDHWSTRSTRLTGRCEGMLATLLVHDPEKTANCYPEWVQAMDLIEWAEGLALHPALVEPFRSGQKLGHEAWMKLADDALLALEQEIDGLAKTLEDDARSGTHTANGCDMLRALDHAEQTWMNARLRITGKAAKPLTLSSEACDRASGEFDAGSARARLSSATTGEVSFDDFVDALKESLQPGTTMDLGKLIQATRVCSARLKRRCEVLRRKL